MDSLAAVPAEPVECPIKFQDCRESPWPRVAMLSLWLLEQVNKTFTTESHKTGHIEVWWSLFLWEL